MDTLCAAPNIALRNAIAFYREANPDIKGLNIPRGEDAVGRRGRQRAQAGELGLGDHDVVRGEAAEGLDLAEGGLGLPARLEVLTWSRPWSRRSPA